MFLTVIVHITCPSLRTNKCGWLARKQKVQSRSASRIVTEENSWTGEENRLMRESIKDSSPAGEENAEDNQSEEATASSDDSDMSEGEHSGKMAR